MTDKREERKLRSEANRRELERHKRARGIRSRMLLVVGVLTIAGAVILGATRKRDSGRVWSPEHGHWHER